MDLAGQQPLPTKYNATGRTKLSLRRKKAAQLADTQPSLSHAHSQQPSLSHAQQDLQPSLSHAQQDLQPSLSHAQQDLQPPLSHAQQDLQPSLSHAQQELQPSLSHAQQDLQPSLSHAQQDLQPSQSHAQQVLQPSQSHLDPQSSQTGQTLPPRSITSLSRLPGLRLVLQRCSPASSPTKKVENDTLHSQQTNPLDPLKWRLGEHAVSPKPVAAVGEHYSGHPTADVESTLSVPSDGILCDSAGGEFGELVFCQLCQKDLTRFSTAQRQQHVNWCCDERGKVEAEGEKSGFEVTGSESDPADSRVCVLCKKVFKSKQPLLAHMKGCARKRGISTAQLLSIRRREEAHESAETAELMEIAVRSRKTKKSGAPVLLAQDDDGDFRAPPSPVGPKRGRKRKQAAPLSYLESLEDEQLQLALAMSASLDPLAAVAEDYPSGTRRKRQRRGGRVAVHNESPPILLLTSSSQAEGVVAQRAEQLLTATKLSSAAGGDGSDDEIPCTPAFAASELGCDPWLQGEHERLLRENEQFLGGRDPEMGGANPTSDVIAIPASSSEDEGPSDGVRNMRSRVNTSVMEVERGVTATRETTSLQTNSCVSTCDVDAFELLEPGDSGVGDGGLDKQPTEDVVEEAGLGEVKEALPPSGEGGREIHTPPRLGEESSKGRATLGGGDAASLSYPTLWQLSNYQECEGNADFYVPGLASVISPVKASLCRICGSDPCVAVTAGCRSPPDVTIVEPPRMEAKSSERASSVSRAKTGVARLTSDLHSLVGSSLLSDVIITTGSGSKVPAHASILACRCPALREVLVNPSTSLVPGSAHLDLSDFDDEVVFACLEYLYTGSSPLLQEEGRGSSPLLQEEGRGSSPLLQEEGRGSSPLLQEEGRGSSPLLQEEGRGFSPLLQEEGRGSSPLLLERFALLAQRLSLEEFSHLFPSDACHNNGYGIHCTHVESCKTDHKSTTDTIGSSVVRGENTCGTCTSNSEEGTSNPEEGTSNPEEGSSNPEEGTSNPEESTSNPEECTMYSNPEECTSILEESTSNPEECTSNPEERTSNPSNPEQCTSDPGCVDLQFHYCENEPDTFLVDNTLQLSDEKSPHCDTPKKTTVGLSELKDTTECEHYMHTPDRDAGSNTTVTAMEVADVEETLVVLAEALPCEARQGAEKNARDCNFVYVISSPEESNENSPTAELDLTTKSDILRSRGASPPELSPSPRGEARQGELSPSPQGEARQGELSPSPQGEVEVESDASLVHSVKSCCSIDSLLTDETTVWNQAQDCSSSRHQFSSLHCEEGPRTGVQIATPRPMSAATMGDVASTTPTLFATPSSSTGAASLAGLPLPANESSGVVSANSEGSRVQQYMTPACRSSNIELESDDNITPMPDYRTMKTPMLKGECSRFGVRALPKKKMIAKLEEIYDYTHPLVDADGNVVSVPEIDTRGKSRAAGSPPKRGKPPAKRRAGKKNSGSQAGSTEAGVDLNRRVQECIMSDSQLYQDILLYKPLELSLIQTRLKSAGANISKEKLMELLDHWCVTYSLPRTQKTNRKT